MNGFLLIDKPKGLTSFDVVANVKGRLHTDKIGHCGTLDPLATGLLIICIGKATKLASFVSLARKTYLAEITLGAASTTYDSEGELTLVPTPSSVTLEMLENVIDSFRGQILQTAPAYSALKHRGKPLYKYARQGTAVPAKERTVEIDSLDILEFSFPLLRIKVSCGSGTYIRSLAHDIGQRLGCGGYISALRRTAIGHHHVERALTLESLANLVGLTAASEEEDRRRYESLLSFGAFVPIEEMLEIPTVAIRDELIKAVLNGVPLRSRDIVNSNPDLLADGLVTVRSSEGKVLAICRSLYDGAKLQSVPGDQPVLKYVRVV